MKLQELPTPSFAMEKLLRYFDSQPELLEMLNLLTADIDLPQVIKALESSPLAKLKQCLEIMHDLYKVWSFTPTQVNVTNTTYYSAKTKLCATQPWAESQAPVYSQGIIRKYGSQFRKMAPIRICYTNPVENKPHVISPVDTTAANRLWETTIFTGRENVCLYSATEAPLPDFISVDSKLVPVDLKFIDQAKYNEVAHWCNNGITTSPKTKDPRIQSELNKLELQYSASTATPMAFVSREMLEGHGITRRDLTDECLAAQISVYRIHKLRAEFNLVVTTVDDYLQNVDKYIAVLNLPKLVTIITPDYVPRELGILCQGVVNAPTLLIPQGLLTSTSKSVLETGLVVLEHINRGSLIDLIDRARHQAAIAALSPYTTYWDGIIRVLGSSDLTSITKDLGTYAQARSKITPLTTKSNNILRGIFTSREFLGLSKFSKELSTQSEQLGKLRKSLNNTRARHNAHITAIEKFKRELTAVKRELKSTADTLQTIETASSTKEQEFQELTVAYDQELKKLDSLALGDSTYSHELFLQQMVLNLHCSHDIQVIVDYSDTQTLPKIKLQSTLNSISNLLETNLVYPIGNYLVGVDEISIKIFNDLEAVGKHPAMLLEQKIFEISKLLLKLLISPQVQISRLVFATEKPVRIYVDSASKAREKCNVIIGGPYQIALQCTYAADKVLRKLEGCVFLSSGDAIFGIKPMGKNVLHLKQHPHSKDFVVNPDDPKSFLKFLQAPTTMCLGEGQAPLMTAIGNKNIEQVRHTLFAWLTSAWSSDEWGRDWHYFPSEDRVDLNGNYNGFKTQDPQLPPVTTVEETIDNIPPGDANDEGLPF